MRLTPARLIERIETRHGSLAATERLAAIVNGWASLEHLANRDNRMPGGFNDWEVVQDSGFSRRPAIKQLRSFVARPAIVTALHGVRVAASVVLILPVRNPVLRGVVGASSATAGVLLAPLHHNGGDGSDQVGTFTQALTAAARLSRSDRVTDVILWATSAQTTLAYLASGWVKLLGKPWREGTASRASCAPGPTEQSPCSVSSRNILSLAVWPRSARSSSSAPTPSCTHSTGKHAWSTSGAWRRFIPGSRS